MPSVPEKERLGPAELAEKIQETVQLIETLHPNDGMYVASMAVITIALRSGRDDGEVLSNMRKLLAHTRAHARRGEA